MSKDLQLEDGSVLRWFNKSYEDFFNKTTIIYGRRESGKSTIVLEIMNLLQSHISIPFIISQSNAADFIGKVPKACIKTAITKEWLEEFLQTQKGRADIYNKANDMRTLKYLFDRVKTPQTDNMEKMLMASANKYIYSIESNPKLDFATKKEQIDYIQGEQVKKLVELYKTNIRGYKHMLDGMVDTLSRDEICCLNYIDFMPHALLVFDDCASIFKKWVKESTVIKEIFYNGRWSYITFIITSQDDKEIESELRKNAMISFFTTQQAAIANFTRASNAYPKHEKVRAEVCTKKVFATSATKRKNHRKLVYMQNSADPFMYSIAEIYPSFKIGCPSLWALDERIEGTRVSAGHEDVKGFFNKYYDLN